MIVHGMTELELMREIVLDFSNAYSRVVKEHARFRRLVIKSKVFPVRSCIKYNSPRKNRWMITVVANNKKMICGKSSLSYAVLQNTDSGIYVSIVGTDDKSLKFHFFTPHFFSRYAPSVVDEPVAHHTTFGRAF